MTTTEKFLVQEKDAKETVTELLKMFDGKSYRFANAALNTVKKFLNEESQFKAANALQKINSLVDKENPAPKKKKTVNDIAEGEKIFEAVKVAVKGKEIFSALLKDARVKSYAGEELTLKFGSEYKAHHFERYYKMQFENTASELFGKEIKVEVEGEN